jgi:homoserine kinase type II
MTAYQAQRPLTDAEKRHWNLVLRAAALRFWLSRSQDKLFPREGELTQIKDPDAFLKILKFHQDLSNLQ